MFQEILYYHRLEEEIRITRIQLYSLKLRRDECLWQFQQFEAGFYKEQFLQADKQLKLVANRLVQLESCLAKDESRELGFYKTKL